MSNEKIYDLKGRTKSVLRRIKNSDKITDHNKEKILKFKAECVAEGLSESRVLFYLNRLLNIARWAREQQLDEMSEGEIKQLVSQISEKDYAKSTKLDYNQAIKKFFKWVDGDDRRVGWIRTHMKKNEEKLPDELLSKEDVKKLLNGTTSARDKAMISVLYEGGLRICEFLGLKIRHVEFDDFGAVIRVHGKTGSRRVKLVSSVPHLSNWLEHHPRKDDQSAPLWVSLGSKNHGKQLSYHAARAALKRAAKKAEVQKPVNPHNFRHSRATELANHLTEAQMKEYFGWTKDSDMASVYVHLSGRDTDSAILDLHGISKEDGEPEQIEAKKCDICGHKNPPETDLCYKCRKPLDAKSAMGLKDKEQEFLSMISSEMVEQMIEKKVDEILNKRLNAIEEAPEVPQH